MPLSGLTAPANKQLLTWDGEKWSPTTLTPASLSMAATSSYTALSYGTGWGALAGGVTPGYRKINNDQDLQIKGQVSRTSGTGIIIATLPVGFRPNALMYKVVVVAGDVIAVYILTDGTINYSPAAALGFSPAVPASGVWLNMVFPLN